MVTAALVIWPILIVILAFATRWSTAIFVGLIGGYLLLPEEGGINLPLLPSFNKDTIPALMLLMMALMLRPGDANGPLPKAAPAHTVRAGWLPGTKLGLALLGLWIAGSLLTALTNGDRLIYGPRIIQGLTLYDGFSFIVASTSHIVPLLLARKYLGHPDMQLLLVKAFVLAALIYSLPTLYEIRMSPQLNVIIYDFFPHSWHQHIRGGAFRPIVFLKHGLKLSIFMAMGVIAAFGLAWVLRGSQRVAAFFVGFWLLGTLVLSNSLTALLLCLLVLPIAVILPARLKILAAAGLAAVVLTYPMLRNLDLVPTNQAIAMAERIDENRARSLEFRIRNEDILLDKASQRPFFGWGGWGRNRAIDENGRDLSVTDGSWVIAFGTGGWAEYIAKFGLLTLPLILLAVRRKTYQVEPVSVVVGLILVVNMLDLIPNSGQSPITWLFAGALLGRLEYGRVTDEDAEDAAQSDTRSNGGLVYTRQTQKHVRKPLPERA